MLTFKLLTGRYGWIGFAIGVLFVGVRFGPLLSRQFTANTARGTAAYTASTYTASPYVDAARAPIWETPINPIVVRHSISLPAPTPAIQMPEREYPNEIWRLNQDVLDKFDALATVTQSIPIPEDERLRATAFAILASEYSNAADELHQSVNKIRSIHPPDRFEKYHANVLRALDELEQGVNDYADGIATTEGLSESQMKSIQRTFDDAGEVLQAFPRTNAVPKATTAP